MSDLREVSVRDLIAELARLEDLLRLTRTRAAERTPNLLNQDLTALVSAEQDIIDELRRPGRCRTRPGPINGPRGPAGPPRTPNITAATRYRHTAAQATRACTCPYCHTEPPTDGPGPYPPS